LPTIATITPTFDVSTIVTVTPAPVGKCPVADLVSDFDLSFIDFDNTPLLDDEEEWARVDKNRENAKENILEFLNTYGASPLVAYLDKQGYINGEDYIYQDLTNDGIPEFVFGANPFHIFGCKNGYFESLFEHWSRGRLRTPIITTLGDFNKNGIQEITFLTGIFSQGGRNYQIYEWNNNEFVSVLPSNYPEYPDIKFIFLESSAGEIHYEDIDDDGFHELVVDSGIPLRSIYIDGFPWRNERTYYKWNGENYVLFKREFSIPDDFPYADIPEFRFQIVQDGDLAISQDEFSKALNLYQRAIHDNSLLSYSPEIRKNYQERRISQIDENPPPTPTLLPEETSNYPKLASYAHYRIMLLQIIQGNLSEAENTYNILQKEFSQDQYSAPYTKMAKEFWQAYQENQNMNTACSAAIQYAAIHPEILIPLGSYYHGDQSHIYLPEDICPFHEKLQ